MSRPPEAFRRSRCGTGNAARALEGGNTTKNTSRYTSLQEHPRSTRSKSTSKNTAIYREHQDHQHTPAAFFTADLSDRRKTKPPRSPRLARRSSPRRSRRRGRSRRTGQLARRRSPLRPSPLPKPKSSPPKAKRRSGFKAAGKRSHHDAELTPPNSTTKSASTRSR